MIVLKDSIDDKVLIKYWTDLSFCILWKDTYNDFVLSIFASKIFSSFFRVLAILTSLDHYFLGFFIQTLSIHNFQAYITSLLSKFEVALQFDATHLLLPSLLPTEAQLAEAGLKTSDVRVSALHMSSALSIYIPLE